MLKKTSDWTVLLSAGVVMLVSSQLARRLSRSSFSWDAMRRAARGVLSTLSPHPFRSADTEWMPFRRRHGTLLRERIVLAKGAAPLFNFWRDLRNLPHVVPQLEQVDLLEDGHAKWVLRGPAARRMTWETVSTEAGAGTAQRTLVWASVPGSEVAAEGAVRFRPLGAESTEVEVVLQYDPPASKVGGTVIWLAGQSPAGLLRDDLRRLKQILETGVLDDQPEPAWLSHWIGGRSRARLAF